MEPSLSSNAILSKRLWGLEVEAISSICSICEMHQFVKFRTFTLLLTMAFQLDLSICDRTVGVIEEWVELVMLPLP